MRTVDLAFRKAHGLRLPTQKQKGHHPLDDGPGLPLISVLTSSSGLQPRHDQGAKQGDPDPDNDAGAPGVCETEDRRRRREQHHVGLTLERAAWLEVKLIIFTKL